MLTNASGTDGISTIDASAAIFQVHTATVARTDTSAKNLFALPAGAVPLEFYVDAPVASDAGTAATVDIGKTGDDEFFVVDCLVGDGDITDNARGLIAEGALLNMGVSVGASAITVTGTYAETGDASTTGGPFVVTCVFYIPS